MSEPDTNSKLRASLAARMLMPREEGHDNVALRRLEEHLLQLRQRIADEALAAQDLNDRNASHDNH